MTEYAAHKTHCFMEVDGEFMGCKYGPDEECPVKKPYPEDGRDVIIRNLREDKVELLDDLIKINNHLILEEEAESSLLDYTAPRSKWRKTQYWINEEKHRLRGNINSAKERVKEYQEIMKEMAKGD